MKHCTHSGVRKLNPTFGHHLHEIPIAQFVVHIPANAEDDNLAIETPVLDSVSQWWADVIISAQNESRSVYALMTSQVVAPVPRRLRNDALDDRTMRTRSRFDQWAVNTTLVQASF